MKSNDRKKHGRRKVAPGGIFVPLVALAIVAMSGSVAPVAAQSFPAAPIFDLNSENWSGKLTNGAAEPGWYKETGLVDPDVVHLQGGVTQTSNQGQNANLIGTLSPAASPDRIVYAIVATNNGTYADIAIWPNGQIWLINPQTPAVADYSFVSLESITYEQFLPIWYAIDLNPDWSPNAGYGSGTPEWYGDGSLDVHLEGAVSETSSSASSTIGTIAGGEWPGRVVYTITHTLNGTYADVAINASGQISLIAPRSPMQTNFAFVSLENLTYGSGINGVSPITPNKTNWSFSAGWGSVAPGWFKDAVGIVHLVGAATQTSATGINQNLLGTLPAAACPTRTVYTIMHTFNGTYADVAIYPNGDIELTAPRSPAVKDFSFVSLECITYQQ
jgi:hypothetical protein